MSDVRNIEFLDMGHNPNKEVLAFTWNNLDFEVDVIDGEIQWKTLDCLVGIVKQVDFPPTNSTRQELERFVADRWESANS